MIAKHYFNAHFTQKQTNRKFSMFDQSHGLTPLKKFQYGELELELYFHLNTVNLSDKIIIRRKITIYFNLYKHDLKI